MFIFHFRYLRVKV